MPALKSAYRKGLHRQCEPTLESERTQWVSALDRRVRSRLREPEFVLARLCKGYCNRLRRAALSNDVAGSCRYAGAARAIAAHASLDFEASLLCRAEVLGAEFYLDLACGDLRQAGERLLQALEIDQQLEDDFGYGLLHAHRIHLLSKLTQLEARSSGALCAMKTAAATLRYLQGRQGRLSVPGSWDPDRVGGLSPGIVLFLTRQLTTEIAGILLQESKDTVRDSAPLLQAAIPSRNANGLYDSMSYRWLSLKLLSSDASRTLPYLKNGARFLSDGPQCSLVLWHTCAIDIAERCTDLSLPNATSFRSTVLAGSSKIEHFPSRLRRRWAGTDSAKPAA